MDTYKVEPEMAAYKVEQLKKMLDAEEGTNGGYGAHLTHWAGNAKPINIDAGAIKALIRYYSNCLMPDDRDIPTEENGDICPVCGAELEFDGPEEIENRGTVIRWGCPTCGATGKQCNDIKFAEHIDVCDRDGNSVSL